MVRVERALGADAALAMDKLLEKPAPGSGAHGVLQVQSDPKARVLRSSAPPVIPREAFDMVRGLPPRRSLGPRPFHAQTRAPAKGSLRFPRQIVFLAPSPSFLGRRLTSPFSR